jgi:membrane protease YdiL (CAAX protease family)
MVGDILKWSYAERDASGILFGPSLVLAGWLLFIQGRGTSWRELGVRALRPRGGLLVPMLLVVDFIFVLAYTGLLDMYGVLPFSKATETLPLSLVNSVVVAPTCEELFYRAVLFTGLRRFYGSRKAAVLSAAIFAIYHLDPLFFVPHFIGGIALAALLDATGSIWASILLHAAWNAWIVMGEAGFWIVALIAFLTMAVVAVSPLWFALYRFWQRAAGSGPPPPP